MYLCAQLYSASHLLRKEVRHYLKTVWPSSCLHATDIEAYEEELVPIWWSVSESCTCTNDSYCSIPLYVALTMVWGYKLSRKQNLLCPLCYTLLSCSGWNFCSNFIWTVRYGAVRFCLRLCWLLSDICESVSFRHGMVIDTTKLYNLILVWNKVTSVQENEKFFTDYLVDTSSVLMEFGLPLRLVGLMNLLIIFLLMDFNVSQGVLMSLGGCASMHTRMCVCLYVCVCQCLSQSVSKCLYLSFQWLQGIFYQ